jgi:mandelate racemase
MSAAPLVLFDVETSSGVVGRSYIFTYTPVVLVAAARLASDVSAALAGKSLAPVAINQALRRQFVLLGTTGLLDMVIAGIDMALGDASAKAAGLPLVALLGGEPRELQAYASFGMDGQDHAVLAAQGAAERHFQAIKIKIGYPTFAEDLAVIRAVRAALPTECALMVDYNQALSVTEAIRRCHALDDEGLAWIEEPVRCDDLAGHARVAEAIKTPVQLGENAWGPQGIQEMLQKRASDLAMPDLMKVGGVTGWQGAAAICEAQRVLISNHFYQETSAHLLSLSPVAHYLEYFGIADAVLRDPVVAVNGRVKPSGAPGCGIEWNEAAVERFQASGAA